MKSTAQAAPVQALIALGSNLPGPGGGPPAANVRRAAEALRDAGFSGLRLSSLYRAAAVPSSAQPDFVNAAAVAMTGLTPAAALAALLRIERTMGRVRGAKNEARIIDLDLLAYGDLVLRGHETGSRGLVLPHPRMQARWFVLKPLCDVAAGWRHPVLGKTAAELLAALPQTS